ncbi:hypothetical protein EC973_004048 [Apophysomyces ossiformis]|uniref:Exportin-7/Ran-binding protein 17 TPR repeats domain-containing protein n=1 Tax=Apophysomyces ossiformis TaxID=679940 RepID=A0A8H7ESP6_9FUNG|nr:hypothetical protein EC973_004048 [Apophysomyces ossiformis]
MSLQDDQTAYYATLCEQLYNPKTSNEHDQAQKILEYAFPTFADEAGGGVAAQAPPGGVNAQLMFNITSPTDSASALRVLLENSPSPYVHTFCLSRLKQLVQAQFDLFNGNTKLQLRSFLLEFAYMHPQLLPFVIAQLASVLASLTLLGWAEIEAYRNIYEDIQSFLQASVEHRLVGLRILGTLVQDINAPSFSRNSAKLRKAAGGFRDTQLLPIFEMAFETLEQLLHRAIPFDNPEQENRMKDATLTLLIRCLSYDFVGTSGDEAGEDFGTVQIPASWRPLFESPNFTNTLFSAYREFPVPLSSKVMECLVQVVSVRKALFTSDSGRAEFVQRIMQGTRDIMVTAQGMSDANNYNEFCRLLYRFRATAPLNEMVEKPGYIEWISLVGEFSLKAFQSWKWASNTASYILGFWSRIVQSMTYYQRLNEQAVKKLDELTVELTQCYVLTMLESVSTIREEMLEDPLDNEDTLIETLNMLGHIARRQYEQSTSTFVGIFDPIALQYQELITQASSSAALSTDDFKDALEIIETKFAWLVYIAGSFIGNRTAFLTSDSPEEIDSLLTTKVLQLMDVQQLLQAQHGSTFLNQKLDQAFIFFFQQFRKSYMGDSTVREIYSKTSQTIGISEHAAMLNVIVRKIAANLQYWADNEVVIRRSLELFHELTKGHNLLKHLRNAETTQLILQNYTSSRFTFLEHESQQHNRELYYQILCILLFAEDHIRELEFHEFMRPFAARFDVLGPLDTIESFQQEPVQRALRDIFIDLRGFLSPIQDRRNFLYFFDWFHPDYMAILLRAIEAWSPDPIVNTLLNFLAEFVHNKNQRLHFEVSSPNGILMFRDANQAICSFGRKILEKQVTDESSKYPYKYKGIALCFAILARCFGGNYINFGIFWLYQDKAIDESLDMMIRLMLNIPIKDLMEFPKLARAYFTMLEEVSREQLMLLPNVTPETFLYLMQAFEQGVECTEGVVRGHACSAIYNICSFVVKQSQQLPRQQPKGYWLMNYMNQYPHILPSLLATLFSLVLFDENHDQWALSRPLYVLILLQREYTSKYINQIIENQLPERQEFVSKALGTLMEGITWVLSAKDRELFTQHVSAFRRELRLNNVVLVPFPTTSL